MYLIIWNLSYFMRTLCPSIINKNPEKFWSEVNLNSISINSEVPLLWIAPSTSTRLSSLDFNSGRTLSKEEWKADFRDNRSNVPSENRPYNSTVSICEMENFLNYYNSTLKIFIINISRELNRLFISKPFIIIIIDHIYELRILL